MKAMTCLQCGAIIKKISRRDEFAHCAYCDAKILIEENKDRIIEINDKNAPEKPLSGWEQYRENRRKVEERARQYDYLDNYSEEPASRNYPIVGMFVIVGIAGISTLILAVNSDSCRSSRPANVKEKFALKTEVSPKPEYPTVKPVPPVKYEVKAQWSGDYDIEHFETPEIDQSKLPTSDPKELKKTVFKNRAVQVKITIDASGEVTSAEAISGHPILAEAAVNAAKKSLFNSRSKSATRVLTYYFRLVEN